MADQADVETVLAALASGALYPDGTSGPSVPGPTCRIYRGWPNPSSLDNDLAAGTINVTVFPLEFRLRNVTRYPAQWTPLDVANPALAVSVSGFSATFSGTADAGQLAGLLVDGRTYVYRTQVADTPALVAANLAALVRADRIALLTNASVGIPGVRQPGGAYRRGRRRAHGVAATGASVSHYCLVPRSRQPRHRRRRGRRQLRRASLHRLCRTALRAGYSMSAPLCSISRRTRRSTGGILLYSVEYATTQSATQPAMLFGTGAINTASFLG